jgi:hypothetical protein
MCNNYYGDCFTVYGTFNGSIISGDLESVEAQAYSRQIKECQGRTGFFMLRKDKDILGQEFNTIINWIFDEE